MIEDITDRVRIRDMTVLAHKRYRFAEYAFDWRRGDGAWQAQTREVYERGDAAAVLPIDPDRGTVILIKQFRLPVFLAGHRAPLIEAIAGVLDGDAPEECARREALEEAGVAVTELRLAFRCFLTPGSVTERMHLFAARYSPASRVTKGGGLEHEGEDIEVLEMPLADALAMVAGGEICDAKTILLLQWAAMRQR